MSLCPNFCECEPCKHGVKLCSMDCRDCFQDKLKVIRQEEHEESVRKQKLKLRHPKVLEVR